MFHRGFQHEYFITSRTDEGKDFTSISVEFLEMGLMLVAVARPKDELKPGNIGA
jgi:hypothetical protein